MSLGPDFNSVIAAAKTGAEWAWVAIYEDLSGPITAYLTAQGASEPDDLASEVFLHAARDIGGFRGGQQTFRSWLCVIAHRRLVDSWRSAAPRPKALIGLEALPEPPGGNVEEEAMERLVTDQLSAALSRLTPDQRAVLSLRIIGGLSLEQTARVLSRRVGAFKALQRRAILALQQVLDETA